MEKREYSMLSNKRKSVIISLALTNWILRFEINSFSLQLLAWIESKRILSAWWNIRIITINPTRRNLNQR